MIKAIVLELSNAYVMNLYMHLDTSSKETE